MRARSYLVGPLDQMHVPAQRPEHRVSGWDGSASLMLGSFHSAQTQFSSALRCTSWTCLWGVSLTAEKEQSLELSGAPVFPLTILQRASQERACVEDLPGCRGHRRASVNESSGCHHHRLCDTSHTASCPQTGGCFFLPDMRAQGWW